MDQAALDNLDGRIRAARTAIAERAALAARRGGIVAEHAEAVRICGETEARLDKERADVDRARSGIWSYLRGVRDARIAEEQQEAAAAEARHAEAVGYRDRLAAELARIDARVKALASADAELEDARHAKQLLLAELDPQRGAELTRLADELATAATLRRELGEAYLAGDSALGALTAMVGALEAARSWGAADMGSRALLVDEYKRDALATAQGLVGTAQAELVLFQRELADVGRALRVELPDLAVGRSVWDTWFDGLLFGALPVQQRIAMSLGAVTSIVDRVRAQLAELKLQQGLDDAAIAKHERARTALLDPAS